MSIQITKYFPTSTYFVTEKGILSIGEQEYESLLSYNLYIETFTEEKYDIRITRTDFKVNKQKIDTKFLEISNRYMEALFPIEGIIDNYKIKIINLQDIKKRILNEDQLIADSYGGEGIDHIRTQFLRIIIDDDKLSEFIRQLYFMKLLNLGMQKFEQKQDYFLNWNILPVGISKWKGNINYQKDNNTLSFEPRIDNAQDLMNSIIHYINRYEYYVNFEEEVLPMYADFVHKINYTGETGRMKSVKTDINISVENKFDYQYHITLQTK
ncbi:hypothetical protein [Elizabethkingia occulta]|uniref:hypothetical protein n=1 Tax=Elizabethkingia occulta TaxID=1867263 RepID=UPI00398C6038